MSYFPFILNKTRERNLWIYTRNDYDGTSIAVYPAQSLLLVITFFFMACSKYRER